MLNIKKILLPVDFQKTSLPLVHQVVALARHFASEVVLVHVVTPFSYAAGTLPGDYVPHNLGSLLDELMATAQKNLDSALGPEFAGLKVSRILLDGDPATEIVGAARDEKADLIAMPTHGYGGFRRFLLGSVAAKVLHDIELPVWTAAHLHEPPSGEFSIRRILCAIDLSEHSVRTLKYAADFAAALNAKLTIAHIPASHDASINAMFVPGMDWRQSLAEAAKVKIAKLQQEAGTNAAVHITHGEVPTALSDAADELDADVMVMGRHVSGARLHTTGYAIVRESPVPVLSI